MYSTVSGSEVLIELLIELSPVVEPFPCILKTG